MIQTNNDAIAAEQPPDFPTKSRFREQVRAEGEFTDAGEKDQRERAEEIYRVLCVREAGGASSAVSSRASPPYFTTIPVNGGTYACKYTSTPTSAARARLWKNT